MLNAIIMLYSPFFSWIWQIIPIYGLKSDRTEHNIYKHKYNLNEMAFVSILTNTFVQLLINTIFTFRLKRVWNKKSGRWSVYQQREPKSYQYIDNIIELALCLRLEDTVGMGKHIMEQDDPRQLGKHLAPVEPQSTREIFETQLSRF